MWVFSPLHGEEWPEMLTWLRINATAFSRFFFVPLSSFFPCLSAGSYLLLATVAFLAFNMPDKYTWKHSQCSSQWHIFSVFVKPWVYVYFTVVWNNNTITNLYCSLKALTSFNPMLFQGLRYYDVFSLLWQASILGKLTEVFLCSDCTVVAQGGVVTYLGLVTFLVSL